MWEKLAKIMNRADLIHDERFSTGPARRKNWPAVLEIVHAWLDTFQSVQEVLDLLTPERFPAVPMMQPEEIIEHPHLHFRKAFTTLAHPRRAEGVRITAPPFHIDGEHLPPPNSAPWKIGQDTMEVLENLLNYDQEKINALKLSGLI